MNHAVQPNNNRKLFKTHNNGKEVGSKLSHEMARRKFSPADLFRERMLKSILLIQSCPFINLCARHCMIIVINIKLDGARSDVKVK